MSKKNARNFNVETFTTRNYFTDKGSVISNPVRSLVTEGANRVDQSDARAVEEGLAALAPLIEKFRKGLVVTDKAASILAYKATAQAYERRCPELANRILNLFRGTLISQTQIRRYFGLAGFEFENDAARKGAIVAIKDVSRQSEVLAEMRKTTIGTCRVLDTEHAEAEKAEKAEAEAEKKKNAADAAIKALNSAKKRASANAKNAKSEAARKFNGQSAEFADAIEQIALIIKSANLDPHKAVEAVRGIQGYLGQVMNLIASGVKPEELVEAGRALLNNGKKA